MNQPAKKAPAKEPTQPERVEAEIREQPIALAYAMVPAKGKPGKFHKAILRGVHAETIELMDVNGVPHAAVFCMDAISRDMRAKNYKRGLG